MADAIVLDSSRQPAQVAFVPPFPPGQKITTQLPANVALIRITMALFFTAGVVAKVGLTVWSWPVMILNAAFGGYTVYKHFLAKDPLVEAFYKIAGSKEKYDDLPQLQNVSAELNNLPNKKIEQVISAIQLNAIEAPCYQATAQGGRKVLIVKDETDQENPAIRVFVEKLSPHDLCTNIAFAWAKSILAALPIRLENSFSKSVDKESPVTSIQLSSRAPTKQMRTSAYSIHAEISTDLINKLAEEIQPMLR